MPGKAGVLLITCSQVVVWGIFAQCALGQESGVDAQAAKSLARRLQLQKASPDPEIRKAAAKKMIGEVLPDDFRSGDRERINEAMGVLRETMRNNGRWCRDYFTSHWLEPLLEIKEYGLIDEIIAEGLSNPKEYSDTGRLVSFQYGIVTYLLAAGRKEEALSAAKVYYNICRIEEAQRAVDLCAEVLANTRLAEDPEVVRRFRKQQEAGVMMRAASGNNEVGEWGVNVLSQIRVNPSVFEPKLKSIESSIVSFQNETARGNLFLMMDRPREARKAFELALDLASAQETPTAIANVARAIRAESGLIGPSNQYILSLRMGKDGR